MNVFAPMLSKDPTLAVKVCLLLFIWRENIQDVQWEVQLEVCKHLLSDLLSAAVLLTVFVCVLAVKQFNRVWLCVIYSYLKSFTSNKKKVPLTAIYKSEI